MTTNLPTAKKRKRGRVQQPVVLVECNENEYDASDFTPEVGGGDSWSPGGVDDLALPPVTSSNGHVRRLDSIDELDQWGVDDRLKQIIVQGKDPFENKKGDNSRSAWLFDVVCNLLRQEVPDDVIYSVITDPNLGISESVLEKGSRAHKYAVKQIRDGKEEAVDPRLRKLNEQFAVIENIGGRCVVAEWQRNPITDRKELTFQSFDAFANRYSNKTVAAGKNAKGEPQFIPLGKWWLRQPLRKQYERVVCAPGIEVPGALNLWEGFAVEPKPGDCSLYLEHLRVNVCGGDRDIYNYVLNWMARAVQYPAKPGYVAIVLRGKKGVGKGVTVVWFGSLFGQHFFQVSNPDHVVGKFNKALWSCVVLFADEAFYAGDKKHESILKAMITELQMMIEPKGVDAFLSPNSLHIIMAGNDSWLVPASLDERRFLVLDVGSEHREDFEYFAAIEKQMLNGGREALLHLLLERDLSDFQVRRVPETDALNDQKALTLRGAARIVFNMLASGTAPILREIEDPNFGGIFVATRDVAGEPSFETGVGLELAKIAHDPAGGRETVDGRQRRGFWLPRLEEAREAWERAHRTSVRWPAGGRWGAAE